MALPIKSGGGAGSPAAGGGLNFTDVKTGAYEAVANDFVLVDHTAGSFQVTMPAAAPINTKIGVLCVGHDSANTDEVTMNPNDYTFRGNHDNKIYLTDDSIIFQSDGASVWRTVQDTLIPHNARVQRTIEQTVSSATTTKIPLPTVVFDNASLADTVNLWIQARRPGSYSIKCGCSITGVASPSHACHVYIYVQAASDAYTKDDATQNLGIPVFSSEQLAELNSGDIVELFFRQASGSILGTQTAGSNNPYCSIHEDR